MKSCMEYLWQLGDNVYKINLVLRSQFTMFAFSCTLVLGQPTEKRYTVTHAIVCLPKYISRTHTELVTHRIKAF